MRWQSFQGWHLSQKSRILLFSSFDGLLWRPCYHLPEKNLTMPSVLQSATNQPDWCSTCVHLGEKVFVNWLSIAMLAFEQIIKANFFSNIFFNIFKIIFRNFFKVLSHYASRRYSKILTVCLEKLVLSSPSLLIFTKCS